jgi:hypothetical protein
VLARVVGRAALPPLSGSKVTRWGSDPWARGSYSYQAVGCTEQDIATLARPLPDNRVFFAGEATSKDHHSTVTGAFISGRRESRDMLSWWHSRAALPGPSEDSLFQNCAPDSPHCVFCGRADETAVEGCLLGPFRLQDGARGSLVMAHTKCAELSPEVTFHGGHLRGVTHAARRGRRLKCSHAACLAAAPQGATIGCGYGPCRATVHYRCALASAWEFDAHPDIHAKAYYCPRHRDFLCPARGAGGPRPRDAAAAAAAKRRRRGDAPEVAPLWGGRGSAPGPDGAVPIGRYSRRKRDALHCRIASLAGSGLPRPPPAPPAPPALGLPPSARAQPSRGCCGRR